MFISIIEIAKIENPCLQFLFVAVRGGKWNTMVYGFACVSGMTAIAEIFNEIKELFLAVSWSTTKTRRTKKREKRESKRDPASHH